MIERGPSAGPTNVFADGLTEDETHPLSEPGFRGGQRIGQIERGVEEVGVRGSPAIQGRPVRAASEDVLEPEDQGSAPDVLDRIDEFDPTERRVYPEVELRPPGIEQTKSVARRRFRH